MYEKDVTSHTRSNFRVPIVAKSELVEIIAYLQLKFTILRELEIVSMLKR